MVGLVVVGCGSDGYRTDTAGTGGATTTIGAIRFPIVARLDPSCPPEVKEFGPGMSGPADSPLRALENFQVSYDHQALLALTLYQALAPSTATPQGAHGPSTTFEPIPPGKRVWAVHLDGQHRVVVVIHTVHGPQGWYVHELQQCEPPTSTTTG